MRTYSDMTDERRLKFLQEYLASDQTKREFEKANGLGCLVLNKLTLY